MSDFSQMLSYHVIYSLPWEYHRTIMVLSECSRYYQAVMIYYYFVELEKSKTNNKQPNQTFMTFAEGLWHSENDQRVYCTHPPFPPLDYDPRMRLTSFWNIGDIFPLVRVLDSLCLQNCGNITLLLFYRSILRQNERLHHFLVSLKTCLDS